MLSCKSDGCTVQLYIRCRAGTSTHRLTLYPKLSFRAYITLKTKVKNSVLTNCQILHMHFRTTWLESKYWPLATSEKKHDSTRFFFCFVVIITFNEPTKTMEIKNVYRKISPTFQSRKLLKQILQTQSVAFHQNLGILCLILANMSNSGCCLFFFYICQLLYLLDSLPPSSRLGG